MSKYLKLLDFLDFVGGSKETLNSVLALFGVKEVPLELICTHWSVLLLAQRLVLLIWKQEKPPTHLTLLKGVNENSGK